MIKTLLNKITGAHIEISHLRGQIGLIENDNKKVRNELTALKAERYRDKNLRKRTLEIISANVGDPTPTDDKARERYVAQVSVFFDDYLEKKLFQMIAQVRECEDQVFQEVPQGMDRTRYDDLLRGTSNAYRNLLDWGTEMKNEHTANITKNEPQ